MKKLKLFVLITYLLFVPSIVFAYEAGIEYDGVYVDYNSLNYDDWKSKASEYLELARAAKNNKDKKNYYSKAAGAYQTVIKIYPADAEVMAVLGHIYGKMNQQVLAKTFLDRGLNLELKNPLVNYYCGIFNEDEKNFRKALKFYNFAYNYGMDNNLDLNLHLAIVNAKLGELEKSKYHYKKAYELSKDKSLLSKIQQLDKIQK